LETGVLALLLHCKFSCIVGDRSFSAAAVHVLLETGVLVLLTPVSNNTGTFTVQQQH
jgi:hypothetical protein